MKLLIRILLAVAILIYIYYMVATIVRIHELY